MAIFQVTGTGFDSNVWSLWPDKDGTTLWAFEDNFNYGFARIDIATGAVIHAGHFFASGAHFNITTEAADLYFTWAQGDNGKYYAVGNGFTLYQFHIATSAGGSTSPLDTYSTVDNTMSISANWTNLWAWTSGGVHYVAYGEPDPFPAFHPRFTVINADAWTVVGSYQLAASPPGYGNGASVFSDKNGDVWFVVRGTTTHFVRWHPADGVTGSVLNVTDTAVTNATLGFSTTAVMFVTYDAVNHAAFCADKGTGFDLGWTGNTASLDLTAFTQNTFRTDDGSFYFDPIWTWGDFYDSNIIEGYVGTQPSGKLLVQADASGSLANTQIGGIVSIIDPKLLTVFSSTNVTAAINSQGGLTAVSQGNYGTNHGAAGLHYNPFAALVYNETLGKVAVTYAFGPSNDVVGSPLYLVTLGSSLAVSPLTLSFGATYGGSNPTSQNISVTTSGAWTIASDQTWLSATASGSGATSVPVSIDITGLDSGVYTGHLTVTATGATGSPQTVTVTLTISATYVAAGGFTASAVEHKSDASPDNLEVTHFLDSDIISEADLRAGLYDFAEIELRVVSWKHPEYGSLKLIKGTLGQVSMKNGLAQTELRGQTQKLTTNVCSSYGQTCRAEVFDGKLSDSDTVANPASIWRCGKSPTGFTFTNSVASSPDAITIIPTTALTFPAITGNTSTVVTLNNVAITAYFVARSHTGAFDLQYSGVVGSPEIFDSVTPAVIAATANGNSLNFNGGSEYGSVGIESPINWAVVDNGGHVLSWAQPWADAVQNWEMMLCGQFFIPQAGNFTFSVAHDDGLFWAIVPTLDHAGDVVTVTAGPTCPPVNQATNLLNQSRTAYNGYSFGQYTDTGGTRHGSGHPYVAADNRQGNRTQQWTVHFPAAGTYNFEFDYTNFEHRQQLHVTVVGQANEILPNGLSSAANPVSGWYDNGRITFTSGLVKDWTRDIQTVELVGSPAVMQIKLFAGNPLPYAPAPGDTFIIQTGCNNLISDCFYKYNNVENFQGENQMPGNFILIQTPNLH